MLIKNNDAVEYFLGFVSPHGIKLPANGEVEIDDKFASHASLQQMIKDGKVSIGSFNANDDVSGKAPDAAVLANFQTRTEFDSIVSAAEFNSLIKGLYILPDSGSKVGTPDASATGADLTGAQAGPFNLSGLRHFITFKFDGLVQVEVNLPEGQIDITTLVNALNGDAEFSKWAVASDAGSGELKVLSKTLGVNSNVEIVPSARSAEKALYLDAGVGVLTAGTGNVAEVTVTTHNTIGGGLAGIAQNIKLYTTDLPGVTLSTEGIIQRISKGKLISGQLTNDAVIESNGDGELKFEVAAPAAIGGSIFVGIDIPAAHVIPASFAPGARLNIV